MSPSLTPFHVLYLVFVYMTFGGYKSFAIEFTIVPLELSAIPLSPDLTREIASQTGNNLPSWSYWADFTQIKNG